MYATVGTTSGLVIAYGATPGADINIVVYSLANGWSQPVTLAGNQTFVRLVSTSAGAIVLYRAAGQIARRDDVNFDESHELFDCQRAVRRRVADAEQS